MLIDAKVAPGDAVLLEIGVPILYRSDPTHPDTVLHEQVVWIERIQPATDTTPELAIWSNTEGSYGVAVERVKHRVVSDTLRGSTLATRLFRRLKGGRKG